MSLNAALLFVESLASLVVAVSRFYFLSLLFT